MSKIKVNNKFKPCRYHIKQNKAVTEVIGSVFLLSIMVSSFSVIYFNVLSIPPPSNPPNVTIVSYIENNNLVIEHQKGEPLSLDTEITINMGIKNETVLVRNYLDADAIKDGEWNIGERVIYPFSYNLSNIRSYFTPYIHVTDIDSNSLVFIGTLDVYPETDLEINITADNMSPHIGSKVYFTVCVTNSIIGTPAVNIEILNILSGSFSYFNNVTSRGFYNNHTGIWNINYLDIGESACLTLTTTVVLTSEATQLAMILDGSGSISSSDWNTMKTGLANSVENSSIFPHDGNIELTVIQFGQTKAQLELGPIAVTKDNYVSIGNQIMNIQQIGGNTPMDCGIRLAADKLRNSIRFDPKTRQIVNLITDGVANCYWKNGYNATYQGYNGWIKGNDYAHTGSYSAKSDNSRSGDFYSNDINTTGATNITVDFWYRLHNTEDRYLQGKHWVDDNDLLLYYYNGIKYNLIANLGGGTQDTWLHYHQIITDSQYFKQNFKILLESFCENGEDVWIDDVNIKTNTKELLNDSFESEYWAYNWWNPALKSAVNASSYLINRLQMTNEGDQFDSLGVGTSPDIYWLKNKIVWPQPGYIAPPYIAGWVKTITTWQDFQAALHEIFLGYLSVTHTNSVKIITSTPSTDRNPGDNEMNIVLNPI
ncbi:MAG: VWA domain-containing protein [Candidatus Thermoplasmatota archaeon]|nr:VWA domain-containing protein [Candidatus Thermoplasmatota archaeon]